MAAPAVTPISSAKQAQGTELAERFLTALDRIQTFENFLLPLLGAGSLVTPRDFSGSDTVKVPKYNYPAPNEYNNEDLYNAYGERQKVLQDYQTLQLKENIAINFGFTTEDKMSTNGLLAAAKYMPSWIRQVFQPLLFAHGLVHIGSRAKTRGFTTTSALGNASAYHRFVDSKKNLVNRGFGQKRLVAFVSASYWANLKKDDKYNKNTDIAQKQVVFRGVGRDGRPMSIRYMFDGMVDGVYVKETPDFLGATNWHYVIANPGVLSQIKKIALFRILDQVEGFNGELAQSQVKFDSLTTENAEMGLEASFSA